MDQEDRLRVAADLRGTAVALVLPGFVLVLNVPSLEPSAELGIPGDPDDHDVAFVDSTGRLAVLSRSTNQTILHVVDPAGPSKVGEVTFRASAHLAGAAGDHVLITGRAVNVVDVMADPLAAVQLPVRGHVGAVGRFGAGKFILSIGGVLEEWDASTRTPGRRLRLDHPIDPMFVGGNAHHLWTIPRKQLDIVDVIALGSRSMRRIELPEPAVRVDAHVGGYLLAVLGAESRSAFIVDLLRGAVNRVESGPITDVAWVGRGYTLVIKPAHAPLELLTIAMPADHAGKLQPRAGNGAPSPPPLPQAPPRAAERPAERPPVAAPKHDDVPPTKWTRDDITERLGAWRAKYANRSVANVATSPIVKPEAPPPERAPQPTGGHPGGWRAELALAVRALFASTPSELPISEQLDDIVHRQRLPEIARNALALLYGAHLAGAHVAPVDLAGVLGWAWNEAVGAGALAAADLVHWRDGRIRLHREVVALLDERPPINGTIVSIDERDAITSTVAVVAPADLALEQVGAWVAPVFGSLLVPNARGRRTWSGFVREARLRGIAPLVRWSDYADVLREPPQPAAIVIEHATTATNLALPIVATWSTDDRSA